MNRLNESSRCEPYTNDYLYVKYHELKLLKRCFAVASPLEANMYETFIET